MKTLFCSSLHGALFLPNAVVMFACHLRRKENYRERARAQEGRKGEACCCVLLSPTIKTNRRPAIYFSETHLCGTCLAPFIREIITFPSPDRDMLLAPPSFLDPVYPSQLARSIRCNRERPPWTGERKQNTGSRET